MRKNLFYYLLEQKRRLLFSPVWTIDNGVISIIEIQNRGGYVNGDRFLGNPGYSMTCDGVMVRPRWCLLPLNTHPRMAGYHGQNPYRLGNDTFR